MRTYAMICLAAMSAACEPPKPSPARGGSTASVSQAEAQALVEKGAADAERNSKVTRIPRRFTGESL